MTQLRIAFTLLLTALVGALSAQTLTVMKEKEKYGYADENGKMIIKAQYTQAYPFENGKAKVRKGDKWGYIDEKGKALIAIDYENIEPFENGIARVKKGGKYGYIKEDGTVYIKPEYDFIGTFNEDGWLWVGKGKSLKESKKGLYRHNQLILNPKYYSLGFFQKTDSIDYGNGSPISYKNGYPKNHEIIRPFVKLTVSPHPYIWIESSDYDTGICDITGKQIIKFCEEAIGMPKDGYAILRSYKKSPRMYKFNYISSDGKNKKLFKKDIKQDLEEDDSYESCTPFNNGIVCCGSDKIACLYNNKGDAISSEFDKIIPLPGGNYLTVLDGLSGMINQQGQIIIHPTRFSDYTIPRSPAGLIAVKDASTKKYGFIDLQGKNCIPCIYDYACDFDNNRGYIQQKELWGVIDRNGKILVQPKWTNICCTRDFDPINIWVKNNHQKWFAINVAADKIISPIEFDDVTSFTSDGFAVAQVLNKWGVINQEGSLVIPLKFNDAEIAKQALAWLKSNNKPSMSQIDAYRFNIYHNADRHKFSLFEPIDSAMWDY